MSDEVAFDFDYSKGHRAKVYDRDNNGREILFVRRASQTCIEFLDGSGVRKRRRGRFVIVRLEDEAEAPTKLLKREPEDLPF